MNLREMYNIMRAKKQEKKINCAKTKMCDDGVVKRFIKQRSLFSDIKPIKKNNEEEK